MSASVAYERQGDAGKGYGSDHRAHVEKGLQNYLQANARANKAGKFIFCLFSNTQSSKAEYQKENKQD